MDKQKMAEFENLTLYWELKIIEWELEKSLQLLIADAEESCNAE